MKPEAIEAMLRDAEIGAGLPCCPVEARLSKHVETLAEEVKRLQEAEPLFTQDEQRELLKLKNIEVKQLLAENERLQKQGGGVTTLFIDEDGKVHDHDD